MIEMTIRIMNWEQRMAKNLRVIAARGSFLLFNIVPAFMRLCRAEMRARVETGEPT
jgi:hypothetical protein